MDAITSPRKGYVDESTKDTERQSAEDNKNDEPNTSKSARKPKVSPHIKPKVRRTRRLDPSRVEATKRKVQLRQNPERVALPPGSSPAQETPGSNPTQEAPRSTPTQETSRSNPTQETPRSNPIQETLRSTPMQETPGSTPTQETPGSTPTQETPVLTPTQETPVLTPTQETPRSTLTQETLVSTPTQEAKTSIGHSILRGVRWMESTTWTMVSIFYAVGTILSILAIPLILVAILFVVYWVSSASLAASKVSFCRMPGISFLEICDLPAVPSKPTLPPAMQNALEYTSKLAEMQTIGTDSVALPYYLRIAEGGIRRLMLELSAANLPTREKLMPLLRVYRDLVERSIDGLQDCPARIDQVVERTILINAWAEISLQRIKERGASSMMASVNNLVNKVFGESLGGMSSEKEVRQVFFGLTNQVQEEASKVIVEAQRQRGNLDELKALLDSFAIAVLGDKELLKREKMNQKGYWKWILQDYRKQIPDFDAKMEMCAHFYKHTEQAITLISTAQLKMQQMREQLIVFRDGLVDTPLMLGGGKAVSLRLYIDTLKAGVAHLEVTRDSTKLLKVEKMRELEQGFLKF